MKKLRLLFMLSLVGVFLPITFVQAAEGKKAPVLLSPKPQIYSVLPGEFIMTDSVNIVGGDSIDNSTLKDLLAFLQEQKIRVNERIDLEAATIVLRKSGDALPDNLGQYVKRQIAIKPEGYLLHIEKKEKSSGLIVIEGNDEAGVFYGIQTLKQLLEQPSVSNNHIEDYPDIKVRGVVEGFYGTPWTHEDRLNQLRFYGRHKLNTYIYAPKDDLYHRAKWREPYPESEMQRMKELIATAKANKVDFVFAVSPGIDIQFDGTAGAKDLQTLLDKFESLYRMGVRSFAVYYDDIEDKSARKQALVLNKLQEEFIEKKGDVKPLLTVPTEYFTLDMADQNGVVKAYTKDFAATVHKQINVMYTGPGVVCESINEADIAKVSNIYQRKMAVWWNYPVNDYLLNKLALGPIYGLDQHIARYSDYFVMNPMEHADLSKITLQTGAEYAWSPERYDADMAWRRALTMQYGDLAKAMTVFADHSSYMDKEWAKVGRPDAPQLRQSMDALFTKIKNKQSAAREIVQLYNAFHEMEQAALSLKKNLNKANLQAAQPQIELLGQLAQYDKVALKMLEAKCNGDMDTYQQLRQETEKNLKKVEASWAKLSEKTAVYFLRESLTK